MQRVVRSDPIDRGSSLEIDAATPRAVHTDDGRRQGRIGLRTGVATGDDLGLVRKVARGVEIVQRQHEYAVEKRSGPRCVVDGGGRLRRRLQPSHARLSPHSSRQPVVAHSLNSSHGPRRPLGGTEAPFQRPFDVGKLFVKGLELARLVRALRPGHGLLQEFDSPVEVALAPMVELTCVAESLPAVLADRLEQSITTGVAHQL